MADKNIAPTTGCNDSSTKEIKETFVSKYGRLFLLVLSGFTFIFICLLYYANKEFRNSQKNIISCYEQHINHADSLYHNMVNYNERYVFNINELSTKVATDSIIKVALNSKKGVSKEQYNDLSKIITSYFDDMRRLHEQYDRKIRHDSLLICTEEQLLKGQTNKLLELHLNKVEHEYSNITIWAAVLTILFLVFSFYSIFKMDELVQHGHEGVRDIRKLTDEGYKTINTITTNGNNLITTTKNELTSLIRTQQQIISDTLQSVSIEVERMKSLCNETTSKAASDAASTMTGINNAREESINLLKDTLTDIFNKSDSIINEKIKTLDAYIAILESFIKENHITNDIKIDDKKDYE